MKESATTKANICSKATHAGVLSAIHEQSADINMGVVRIKDEDQGAGDQGMMFGYATNETENYMPLSLDLSHLLLRELAVIRREGKEMKYLRPDSKSQVTVEYDDNNKPARIHTIVVSTQHDEFVLPKTNHPEDKHEAEKEMQMVIKNDVQNILIPRILKQLPERIKVLFKNDYILHVNPTGKFVIGGPHGDTGLTGRKIIVDTYGGKGAHGGGAFSGKDSSKGGPFCCFMLHVILLKTWLPLALLTKYWFSWLTLLALLQPVSLFVNTYGTSKVKLSDGQIAEKIAKVFDNRPFCHCKTFWFEKPNLPRNSFIRTLWTRTF